MNEELLRHLKQKISRMPCNALRRVYPYQLKEWLEVTDTETEAFVESASKEGIIRIKFDFICDCGNANTAYYRSMKLLGGFICAFCEKKYSKADIVNRGEILYELDKFAIMEYQKDATDFKEYYSDDRNVICMPTKKEKNKMEIFMGSSSEAAKFMEDIAVKLESLGHKPLLWSDVGKGIFPANSNTIDALIAITERVDAAVFIFSADDKTWNDKFAIGDKKAVRDNVLLEYGLFVGALGKGKVCFVIKDYPKEVTDLKGIIYIDGNQGDNTIKSNLRDWLDEMNRH